MLLDKLVSVSEAVPESEAISHGSETITYASLVDEIRRFGTFLANEFREQSRAILVLENSIDYVIALYGCWYAGLIAVPVDANGREREITQVVNQTSPGLIITSGGRRNATAVANVNEICLVDTAEERKFPRKKITPQRENSQEALLIYTSGTSGNPKGVVLTHKNLLANTEAIVEYLELSCDDSSVVVLPFHYSYGNSVLNTHLFVGARLIIGDSMMYPQQVVDQLRSYKPTGFSGVPTTMSLLLTRTDFAKDPPRLRYITQAGGAMGKELTKALRDSLHTETSLVIMYGQTEATARLTWLPPDRIDEKIGSAGTAIPGVEICIVRKDGKKAEAGEPGEVLARGDNIMSGYWGNPTATASTIVDGWLHTGDVGYVDADGFLFLQGRASEMIKTGAYRVSPGEIEEVIVESECVNEVAVCGVPDELLGQVIVAFVVGTESASHAKKILSHCRRSLSLYKVPREIIWETSLPKTASGKIKKNLLVQAYENTKLRE